MLKLIQSFFRIVQFRITLVAHTAASASAYFQEICGMALDVAWTGNTGRCFLGNEIGSKQITRTCHAVFSFLGTAAQDGGTRTGNGCSGEVGGYVRGCRLILRIQYL